MQIFWKFLWILIPWIFFKIKNVAKKALNTSLVIGSFCFFYKIHENFQNIYKLVKSKKKKNFVKFSKIIFFNVNFLKKVEDYSNRVGRYFTEQPLSRGDCFALIMEGRVEYIGTWLGLSKANFVTALVNTNLRGDVLIHSINAAKCKAVIFSSEMTEGTNTHLIKKIRAEEVYFPAMF